MRYTFILLIGLLILNSCSKSDQFMIKGSIENAATEKIFFTRMDVTGDVLLDSAVVGKNGSFEFKHKRLTTPTFFKLSLSPTIFITLIGDSTEQITINADRKKFTTDYQVQNSQGSAEIKTQNLRVMKLRSSIDSLITLYNELPDENKNSQLEVINNQLVEEIDRYKQQTGQFILEHPRSFASYYALFLTLSDGTQIMDVMNKKDQVYFSALATSLNLIYPESQRVQQLYNIVLNAKAEERRIKIMDIINNAEGSDMPDLKIEDKDGNEKSLAALRGKVVLLSFWASWDEASVRENIRLKSIYNKYNSKGFEVYQVGLERSKVLWENAIISAQLPWVSVTELRYTNSTAARMYNIQQIPANYLIDKNGEIIGKNLFGNRLENKLKEIL
ncbi:MAG TPA: TlpA disulfide reductase family protein [Marinilabiliaceae bacterium]|nr:TlpA disulfide reductase family protein [Marinilabiliaceae bacterium]